MFLKVWATIVVCFNVVCCNGIDPLLSLPGNMSSLVLIDLHTEYTASGTCELPVWDNFLLAQHLLWKHQQQNNSNGLLVYDTCGSGSRVLQILREQYMGKRSTSQQETVVAIISYTKPEIAELISTSAQLSETLHVSLGTQGASDSGTEMYDKGLSVDMASNLRISAIFEVLERLEWRYITTVSDNNPVSLLEHDLFISAARDRNMCIQYSQTPHSASKINMADLNTPGVVIFATDQDFLDDISRQLSDSTVVFVITHSVEPVSLLSPDGVVVSDSFNSWGDFAKNISEDLWRQSNNNSLTTEYYKSQYNCSLNDTSGTFTCSNIPAMFTHVLQTSTGLPLNLLSYTDDMVTLAIEELTRANCSDIKWTSCLNMSHIVASSKFSVAKRGTLELTEVAMELFRIKERVVNKTKIFTVSDAKNFATVVTTWLSSVAYPFPSSQCTGWCPSCQTMSCDTAQQITYTDNYYVIPGDVFLLGMFPLSTTWDESGGGHCSGVSVEMNTDILTEAFLFAIRSAKVRYEGLLTGVDVGALVLDTCSNPRKTIQLLMNFQSCLYHFTPTGNAWPPSPYITPASLTLMKHQHKSAITDNFGDKKLGLVVDEFGNINQGRDLIYDALVIDIEAVVKILHKMKWSHVGVIKSENLGRLREHELYAMARTMNICVAFSITIPETGSVDGVITAAQDSNANTVLLFATSDDVNRLFRGMTSRKVVKTWIVIETKTDIDDITAYPLPLGTIFMKKKRIQNTDFNMPMQTSNQGISNIPWKGTFDSARNNCTTCMDSSMNTLTRASDIIRGVDVILNALDRAYTDICPGTNGLCTRFWEEGASQTVKEIHNVEFVYQEERINLSRVQQNDNYIVYNYQASGLVEVGQWSNGNLTLNSSNVKSYNSLGVALESPRDSYCITSCDVCVNFNNFSGNRSVIKEFSDLDEELGYKDSSAEFDGELWSIIVVVIAGSGSLLTIFLMIYIMCKVCSGALVRRYLALGILLLLAMVIMFMSVLPFVFTPSETVCGMRFFAHGFSYAFCFAIILTKMTTLRDYRYIGLGGEISRINQALSVLFITGVQVAVGVEWWVLQDRVMYSQNAFERDNRGMLTEKTFYACDFERGEFLAYHSFVLCLIVLCCFYAIGVRKETKNMKEARLLLVCSWFCLAIWIALVATVLLLDREMLEAVCAIGLLATALTMLVVIYLPKITAISRLKYEVEQAGRKENGYKIDPDFQFERPYSLPGTMHSSITDKTMSYPRSLAAFDTSLSY